MTSDSQGFEFTEFCNRHHWVYNYTSWVTWHCSGKVYPPWHSIIEIPLPIAPLLLYTLPISLGIPPPKRNGQTDKRTDISVLYI